MDQAVSSMQPTRAGTPAPALPKGGGALRGISEKLTAHNSTCTASLTLPVYTTAASGPSPELLLSYGSGTGNGPFGQGWTLPLPAISRRTDKGVPAYTDDDAITLSGGEDIVPALVADPVAGWVQEGWPSGDHLVTCFRPRVEGAYTRVERWEHALTGDVHWRTVSRASTVTVYGRDPSCRLADPADPSRVFSWLVEEERDPLGGVLRYEYKHEDMSGVDARLPQERSRLDGTQPVAYAYLKRIRYGNTPAAAPVEWAFEVVVDYGEHDLANPTPDETAPWGCRPDPFSSYRTGFDVRAYRRGRRILLFHHLPELGAQPCLVRSTDLEYTDGALMSLLTSVRQTGYVRTADGSGYDRQSTPPVVLTYSPLVVGDTMHTVDPGSLAGLPAGVDGTVSQWVDLDGEGIAGVLTADGTTWRYKRNLGGARFGPIEEPASTPTIGAGSPVQLLDLDGNGRRSLVSMGAPTPGHSVRHAPVGGQPEWLPFAPLPGVPHSMVDDPAARLLDLTGDGRADLLLTAGEQSLWFRSLGTGGFAAPVAVAKPPVDETGSPLAFAEAAQTIHLADMSGDGLTDLVRIRNGDVSYWPNLGHGRFGPQITMANPPVFDHEDQFDPARLRLGDVDGSGPTDIVYLGRQGVRYWSNEAGNGWGAATELTGCPPIGELTSVALVDLLGIGTSCLVWSEPLPGASGAPLRYLDLLAGGKPHLLTEVDNNLGTRTVLTYATSTGFFLADAAAGRPWATRLPFPVQIVERVDVHDLIAGTVQSTRYAPRDGRYDHIEGTFCGFGSVTQWDSLTGAGADAPVRTVTWHHTGAEPGEEGWPDTTGYHQPTIQPIPPVSLPADLTLAEQRDACRALKGSLLRQEIYADDGTPLAGVPYQVTQRGYRVRRVQRGPGDRSVFAPLLAETVLAETGREATTPRVSHQLTLAVDDYGNVTRSASAAYGDPGAAHAEQRRTWVTCTENDYTTEAGHAGRLWIGAPVARRVYEVTGLTGSAAALLDAAAISTALDTAAEIPFEAAAPATGLRRRLIAADQSHYWSDDLTAALPLGEIGTRALLCESRVRVFTETQVNTVLAPLGVDAALMGAEAGYVRHDGAWWAASGRTHYDPDLFFRPVRHVDQWGRAHTTGYDPYALAVVTGSDPLLNTTTAELDYRTMLPRRVTDANGQSTEVAFDALGRVTALAVLATATEPGDTLADPTTRFEYHLDEYADHGRPAFTVSHSREQHGSANPHWQTAYHYHDGTGREIMAKVPAEPGLAPQRGTDGSLVLDDDGNPVLTDTAPAIRWVGTGRTVFDAKNRPIRQYEPYFSRTPAYEDEPELVEQGVTPVLHYDPLGRVVRIDKPDGTYTRSAFGSWRHEIWDENDTVLSSDWYATRHLLDPAHPDRRCADLTTEHAATPTVVHLDALGRPIRTEYDNGTRGRSAVGYELDVQGVQRSLRDGAGAAVVSVRADMLGRTLVRRGVDSGVTVELQNAVGHPVRTWTGDDQRTMVSTGYDELQRPVRREVRDGAGAVAVAEFTVYGESLPDAAQRNLLGRPYLQFDQAGVVSTDRCDRHGNVTESTRRFTSAWAADPDWAAVAAAGPAGALTAAGPLLDPTAYTTTAAFDALNRPTTVRHPDGSEVRTEYNAANLIERVLLRHPGSTIWQPYVAAAAYNARGQRTSITTGNGAVCEVDYDPSTFKVARLRTTRPQSADPVQDLRYVRDPVGNVVQIDDDAQSQLFFDNALVTATGRYTYDARYQLVTAEGREHVGQVSDEARTHLDPAAVGIPHSNDAQAMRRYTEHYDYDDAGNITQVRHVWQGGSWQRRYAYVAGTNQLATSSRPGDPAAGPFSDAYSHDDQGNLTRLPGMGLLSWDFRCRLRSADLGGGGTVHHLYDSGGTRVRTVVQRLGGLVEDLRYVGGYESYERASAIGPQTQRHTVSVAAGVLIAQVQTTTRLDGVPVVSPVPLDRYQVGDHVGTVRLELDGTAKILSYAEYLPFGSCSYQAGSSVVESNPRRRGFAGMQRDPDTGLDYGGDRWYVPWLGRWLSADPAGVSGQLTAYGYVSNNPVGRVDVGGRYDPAAFADELDGYVDVAERFYLAEDTGLASSLWNTFVATTATVVKGSTNILRVGTGAAAGVEQIKNAEDGWDIAIGVSRILVDAGDVAGAAVGVAGNVTKVARVAQGAKIGNQMNKLRKEYTLANSTRKKEISKQLGEMSMKKLSAESGMRSVGDPRIPDGRMNGVDDVLVSGNTKSKVKSFFDGAGRRPFSKKRTVAVEGKGRGTPRPDPIDELGSAQGRDQGSVGYNRERLNTAAQAGNNDAREAAQRLAGGKTTNESVLTVVDSKPGGGSTLSQLSGATDDVVDTARAIPNLGSEIPTLQAVGAVTTFREPATDNLGKDIATGVDLIITFPGPWQERKQ
ncbi:RHS repeat-associated protein [Allocatelliglobosispora scoriae]|uniref:RHS repeat-associated protein n=1 Tax=Allocatelliglobosispora scoriae TaxID=643052 RepID=A0A841C514_9ACTN|nr:SpvB/TcaC N-terminal domain-containing protein [Allocatelliglobosispora scoriae]MBB5874379.1 RHS repeat-associated protein [Allocatelliglobosispora scoriae]